MNLGPYAKALNGSVIAAIAAAITALQDGNIVATEWVSIDIAFVAAAVAIFAVPNVPKTVQFYGKMIVAALVTAGGVLGTGLSDGVLSQVEILSVLFALLNGFVVSQTPNARASSSGV